MEQPQWDTALLADLCARLLHQYGHSQDFPFGTYHVAASGTTTWCDYARFVLGAAGAAGTPVKAGPEAVRALETQAYPTPARRPRSSRLDTALFCTTFGLRLPPWEEGVQTVLQQILESERCSN